MTAPIIVERHVAASPSVVYSYLTESGKWSLWQGVDAHIDARAGGIFSVTMPGGERARGQFIELVRDRRVVFSWGWIDREGLPPGSTTVEIELLPHDEGTLIRLTHRGLPDGEIDLHAAGWNRYLPRLAAAAGGRPPSPEISPS